MSTNSSHGNDERLPDDVLLPHDIYIPLDLTREVLLRLPAKSMARFRCVSKEWLSITTQPDWPYCCTYVVCSVKGDIPFLVAHLRDDHKVHMHSGSSFRNRYIEPNPLKWLSATWETTVKHCFGQKFCVHFEDFQLGMSPVYMVLLYFMGDETEARKYKYSLQVGDDHDRKLIWEGRARSLRDNHRKVRGSLDGLIIQRDMALLFSGGDRKELKLKVTGRIWIDE